MKDNGSPFDNVANFPKSGNDAIRATDAGYLRWLRITANDTQLLGMRNELRMHREQAEAVAHDRAAHETLQQEFMLMAKFVTILLARMAVVSETEPDGPVIYQQSITTEDLEHTGGMNLDIRSRTDTEYLLTLQDPRRMDIGPGQGLGPFTFPGNDYSGG